LDREGPAQLDGRAQITKGQISMRPRISRCTADAIKDVQNAKGLETWQAAHNVVIAEGLRACGVMQATPTNVAPCNDATVTVPVPSGIRAAIRALAARECRSIRQTTRIAIIAGLAAMGVLPPSNPNGTRTTSNAPKTP
jgi:hypothetical protein